jgi:hypothetical protein
MADLTCLCGSGDELLLNKIPDDCGSVDFGYPYLLILQRPEAVNVFAGDVPTVAEIEALQLATDETKMIILGPITNGKKAEKSRQSESGADTIDGLETVYSQNISIEGKLKFHDENIIDDLADLNCYTRLRMWWVSNTGYIFGDYTVPNFISEFLHDGFGTKSYNPIMFEYVVDRKHKYTATAQDDDYLTLSNA